MCNVQLSSAIDPCKTKTPLFLQRSQRMNMNNSSPSNVVICCGWREPLRAEMYVVFHRYIVINKWQIFIEIPAGTISICRQRYGIAGTRVEFHSVACSLGPCLDCSWAAQVTWEGC